jgi:hypothetical protein
MAVLVDPTADPSLELHLPLCNLGTTEKTRIMSGYYWHFQDQHLSITFFTFCLRNNNLASSASHFADPISTSEHHLLCILLIQDQHLSTTRFQHCFTLSVYQSSAKFLISLTICICLAALIPDSKPS